ncbi:hypothetical protein ACF09G_31815 [Streptomyces albogriseolus]|uniref:hypothetical protein n=1 Tax=Streptomyces TaxID=1883 RepID=UPI001414E7C0|nr:hypothetical protein [Streptomyces sp. GC420]MBC7273050.1 hypothetical protein [Streptomyces sp.]NBM14194.1 hypothetical protein [Streptomyces sp. GC420]
MTSVETLDPAPVTALQALLDTGAPTVATGDPLPPMWQWVALPRWPASSVLGPDGHPRPGDFLPRLNGLPRRMFAGGETLFYGTLRVGADVVRESVVDSVEEKVGRSGRFAIVRVSTTLSEPRGPVLLRERQDILYRPPATVPDPATLPDPVPPAARPLVGPPLVRKGEGWTFVTDPTLLMRFSAATANAHRIHYDWPYATRVEGYPGLVVHGPLSTLVLAEALRLTAPDRTAASLRHRNNAPLFCGSEGHVSVTIASDSAEATLRGGDGTLLTHLSVGFVPRLPKGAAHA